MDLISTLRQAIQSAYPQLAIESAELILHGQNSDVLVVNGGLVFRFPRYPEGIERLRAETALLSYLRGRLPLPAPDPEYVHLEGEGPAFVGYRRLPGEPLFRPVFAALNATTQSTLAKQAGTFLRRLHAQPLSELTGFHLPVSDTAEEVAGFYQRVRDELFPAMRPDARQAVAARFERYLSAQGDFSFSPALKHGDFGTSNLLYDRAGKRLSGVIDFGGAGLGDPAYDLAGLLASYGEGFLEAALQAYPEAAAYRPRIDFYKANFALEEALFGLQNGDEAAYRAGMAAYI